METSNLKQILDEILSPPLLQRGLNKRQDYKWYSNSENGIRRVFSYKLLKGASGTFSWGVNLDFIPTVHGNKLINHRTEKSVIQHISNFTNGYANSFSGSELSETTTTLYGKYEAKKISQLFKKYRPVIFKWFEDANSIEALTSIVKSQITLKNIYKIVYPRPKYILAFLLAKQGNIDEALLYLNQLADSDFNNNDMIKAKVIEKLDILAKQKL